MRVTVTRKDGVTKSFAGAIRFKSYGTVRLFDSKDLDAGIAGHFITKGDILIEAEVGENPIALDERIRVASNWKQGK